MRTFKITLVTLIALSALMYFTNPKQEQFNAWMKQHIEDRLDQHEEGLFGGALNEIFSDMASALGQQVTSRRDYHIFSIYEVDFGQTEYHYLGLFNAFVPLQTENPLDGNVND